VWIEEPEGAAQRYAVMPDPAWDWSEEPDGVLTMELSWAPDALAGRAPDFVASPALVAALSAEGLTGYRTAAARGYFHEDAFGVEPGEAAPALVRVIVEADPAADFSYERGPGLTVSPRALAVLRAHCQNLQVEAVG
jgi:hypothetical protein